MSFFLYLCAVFVKVVFDRVLRMSGDTKKAPTNCKCFALPLGLEPRTP